MSQIDDFLNDSNPNAASATKQAAPTNQASSEVNDFLSDAPTQGRGITGIARDLAAWGVKGAIGVPEAVVGLGDIVSGGRLGKALENDLRSRGQTILSLVSQVEAGGAQTVLDYRTRLENKIKEVLANTAIDESRILTEAAIFADKVAVDEETVRFSINSNLQCKS